MSFVGFRCGCWWRSCGLCSSSSSWWVCVPRTSRCSRANVSIASTWGRLRCIHWVCREYVMMTRIVLMPAVDPQIRLQINSWNVFFDQSCCWGQGSTAERFMEWVSTVNNLTDGTTTAISDPEESVVGILTRSIVYGLRLRSQPNNLRPSVSKCVELQLFTEP